MWWINSSYFAKHQKHAGMFWIFLWKSYQASFYDIYVQGLTIVTQITKFMRPTWDPSGSCRPQMGPMLAPWTFLSGNLTIHLSENLALNKYAWLSQKRYNIDNSLMAASYAVDGSYASTWQVCAQTEWESYPTWMVDLGNIYHIGYIRVTNRDGKCQKCGISINHSINR